MRKIHWLIQKIVAPLLCVLLTMNAVSPFILTAAEADKTKVIHIKEKSDWEQLIQNCRLDSWSEGITVSLDNDLDISGCGPVPTFGGTFNGNDHTLRGLNLEGEGNEQGLFRYLREGAVIKDLSVCGVVTPTGNPEKVGGLVGQNSGILLNCHFLGVVSGKSGVGGLAGVNTVTGRIENCTTALGAISGEHFAGGIAGENYGSIVHCINYAQVNIEAVEPVPQLKDFDWERLNDAENMPSSTDIGGIAGYSQGMLQLCSNHGPVGYPHMGYNIGGVVGRQSGMMVDCENNGKIQGRKDVGGIVGQAEPFTELQYEESTLEKLGKELESLSSLMSETLTSTDDTRRALSGHISNITDHTDNAKDDVAGLLDGIEEFGSESIDTVNDLSGRVQLFMQDLTGVTGDMEDAADRFAIGLGQISDIVNAAQQGSGTIENASQNFEEAMSQLSDTFLELVARIPVPLDSAEFANLTPQELLDKLAQIGEDLEDIYNITSENKDIAVEGLQQAIPHLKEAIESMGNIDGNLDDAFSMLEKAAADFMNSSDYISSAFSDLRRAIADQAGMPMLQLPKLPQDFHDQENDLRNTLGELNSEMEKMNQTANKGGDILSDHLKKVNDQFDAVTDVIRNAGEDQKNKELLIDLSAQEAADATWGKVQHCKNEGAVEGDVNIGGIAGSMAIEYDFDPEDDVIKKGDSSLNFRYLTRAILLDCENRGDIVSRKDCVGSIVGRMDLGVVLGGQGFGSVESTSGECIGGIAGCSSSLIRDSWAKCNLKGTRLVGGVAGQGHDIRNCKTLVNIEDSSSSFGAIAGEADGVLEQNVFVSSTLGGIDGISYQGSAYPISYQTLMESDNLPNDMKTLTVTFTTDEGILSTINVGYGEAVAEKDIPEVPEREGYYGAWSEFDKDKLLFSAEVEAVYTPWLTSAASEDGKILVEGNFRPGTKLALTKASQDNLPVNSEKNLGTYRVQLPEGESNFTAIRVALPEDAKSAELWMLDENKNWKLLDSKMDGSYLRAELSASDVTICLAKTIPAKTIWICILGGAIGLLLVLILVKKLKNRPKKSKKQTSENKNDNTVSEKEAVGVSE